MPPVLAVGTLEAVLDLNRTASGKAVLPGPERVREVVWMNKPLARTSSPERPVNSIHWGFR